MRDPLKPLPPELAQLTTFPLVSVKVTIVLLKVALIWAMPIGIFFFSFLFAVRLGLAIVFLS